jgi:hypothetical protein
LDLDDPVFGNSWTRYWGSHSWFNCDIDTLCWCEGHDCNSIHEIEGHAAAAAATAKGPKIPLIVV